MKKIKLSSILFILCFMTLLGCNIFIYFLSLAILRIGTLFIYIQLFVFLSIDKKKTDRLFSFSYHLFIFVHFFILIIWWYQSSNLRALIVTFIMVKIIDPLPDFSSPYHVSSQQHMICFIDIQQETHFW